MSESDSSNALPLAKVREPPPALTRYRSLRVAGWLVFYREAGPQDAPAILLLHGFPSSSRMFEPLLKGLADSYHLIAPDYIGFGHSEAPPPAEFEYSFGRLGQAEIQTELFTITEPMSRAIRSGKIGSSGRSRAHSSCGENMMRRSTLPNPMRTSAICRTRRSMSSTRVTSRWMSLQTKLRN